ncbi:Transportin-3 [Tyrophagus putrescentiae]|nr:Transportin-3 [Tyrophagus putrescentiae]
MSQMVNNNGPVSSVITEMPELEQVYSLIKGMYQQNDLKESASKWLEALQKSVYGWHIADQLLIQARDFESSYFAAQTLKTKIQYHFEELPADSYDDLKNSIISHLAKFDEKVIQTQLGLCVTFIFFRNPNWLNPLEELSVKLSKKYDENRPAVKMTKPRRDEIGVYLAKHLPNVAELLMSFLEESLKLDPVLQEQLIIKFFCCIDAWFVFVGQEHVKSIEPILRTVFSYLKNPDCTNEVHEKASDALVKMVIHCEGHAFADLQVAIMNEILTLEPAYENALLAEDFEKLMNFARIFSEQGNSVLEYLIHDQVDDQIVKLILKCTGHFDFDVAATTFTFWYNFSEVVFKRSNSKFAPHLNLLLTTLTRHCQLESDSEEIVDEKSDQYDYRFQISELVREIIPCCDWVQFLKSIDMVNNLKSYTQWNDVEMNLFMIYCIVCDKNFVYQNENKNDVLPEIVNFVLQFSSKSPPPHVQVLATSCDLLAELNEWVNENSAFLNPVITYLLSIISTSFQVAPKLAARSCLALKAVIKSLKANIELDAIRTLFVNLEGVYIKIDDVSVDLSVSLMACLTAIVSNANFSKYDEQEFFVERIINLCLKKIGELKAVEGNQKKWEKVIDNIYAIFKDFQPNEKTLKSEKIHTLLLTQIWPFLQQSITHFCSIESQAIEHCSRCVRHIVRSMKPSYLLHPIVNHIVPLYQQYPNNSPLLYIGSVLVSEFGHENDPSLSGGLILMLNAFSMSTFNFLNQSNLNLYPYTIADFFNLATRMLTKLTENFVSNTETLNNILNLAIMSVYLDQKEAYDSVIRFIIEFIRTSHPMVDEYLRGDFGRRLFFALVDSIMFKLPSYFVPEMVDALWEFKVNEKELFNQNLQLTVEQLLIKAQSGSYNVSSDSLKHFYDSVSGASNPKRLVSEVRHLQRLFS